jgi:N4-gp56 family major capsid protein
MKKILAITALAFAGTAFADSVTLEGQNIDNSGATAQIAAGATLITDIHLTDVFSGLEVRKAVRTLKLNKAQRFESGLFRGIIGPASSYDLFGNSEWLDAHRYTTSDAIERGVVGKLHGVEFVETNNQYVALSGGFSGTPVTAASDTGVSKILSGNLCAKFPMVPSAPFGYETPSPITYESSWYSRIYSVASNMASVNFFIRRITQILTQKFLAPASQ